MKYTKEDIKFNQISSKGFENLCYDLLVKYSFKNLIWREGGADNGRDIEATFVFNNTIQNRDTRWFFECKHYTSGGVPPSELISKIAWADAESPNSLVIFISSYLTNNSRTWIDKIKNQKKYKIISIEGEELKERLIKYPDLVERYFALDRYSKLLKDIKDYKIKFGINPSFEFYQEIVPNIDLSKLDTEDISFLLTNFYDQYNYFESRGEYYDDFDETVINPILAYLKENHVNDNLTSFEEYKGKYLDLGGHGILYEMEWLDSDEYISDIRNYNFQIFDLHLNHNLTEKKWKVGKYLFIIYDDVAFEIFQVEQVEIRIIKDFNPEKINQLSLDLYDKITVDYKRYLDLFSS